ncbi:MAG TPA: beta-mannanase [Campylobacterales bacterium]|nr:beta-mannanase [Campylobacterales bacterium]HHS93557.1 beta-mannanase [Campylobacterales bacterium]
MQKIKLLLLLILSLLGGILYPSSNKKVKLLPPPDDKIYFAAFPDFGASEDLVTEESITKFEKSAGKKMAFTAFSQHWFKGLAYPKDQIQTIANSGAMPYVRLLPRSSLEQFKAEKHFSLEKIIEGQFDTQLSAWAKAAKKHGIPILVDFGVEMNGDWFGWSGAMNGAGSKDHYGDPKRFDGAEKYRDAYRHIIDIFRAEELHHITWVFHPNVKSIPNTEWNQPKHYYPGDDYIDWIGISIYGAIYDADYPKGSYWDTFEETLKENHKSILEISSTKPFAILEFGVTDQHPNGSKVTWLKDAFKTILSKKYITFKAISYWDESWENGDMTARLKIDSSPQSLKAFREAVQDSHFISKTHLSER